MLALDGLDDEAARQLLDERSGDLLPMRWPTDWSAKPAGTHSPCWSCPPHSAPPSSRGKLLPQQLTVTAGVERAFLDRCRRLGEEVQMLLLVTAADATGRVGTVRRAAAASWACGRPRGRRPRDPAC